MAKERIVLSTRLEPEYIRRLDDVAYLRRITRSSLLREFAIHATDFYDFMLERQKNGNIQLDENLTQYVLNKYPRIQLELLRLVSDVLEHAAEAKEATAKGAK